MRADYEGLEALDLKETDSAAEVPGLIWGQQVVQGLRVVPVFLYRYSMKISLKKARSLQSRDYGGGQIRLGPSQLFIILPSTLYPMPWTLRTV